MMKRLGQRVLAGVCEASAVAAVEYAIVLCLIVVVCISTLRAIGLWNAPVFALLDEKLKV